MEKSLKKQLKYYFKDINRKLLITRNKKSFFISFKNSVYEFTDSHPSFTMDDILQNFGTPDEIAKSFALDIDYKLLNKRTKIKRLLISSIFALSSIIIIYLSFALVDVHRSANGYIVSEISDCITEEV